MPSEKPTAVARFRALHLHWLLVAIGINWTAFSAYLWSLLNAGAMQSHPVRQELMAAVKNDAAIKYNIAGFIGAQLLLYMLLGSLAWLLAVSTNRLYPNRFRMSLLTVAWSAMLLAVVHAANAAAFPWSLFAGIEPLVSFELLRGTTIADAILLSCLFMVGVVLVRGALTVAWLRAQFPRLVAYGLLATCAVAAFNVRGLRAVDSDIPAERPHVIVIGIDSLRPDVIGAGTHFGFTPSIDEFLGEATRFEDCITPLARTFASWSAVLSGRHPVRSGARDNLMPADVLQMGPTLADRLRSIGYTTAYATDEVRFSNIDESYGFDQIVSPRMGSSDFVLASWGDVPLSNLIVNSRLGASLFPNVYANRAASETYLPETFVDWIDEEVDFEEPTFLALHLTLPHSPYFWADDADTYFAGSLERPYSYLASVMAADRQFGYLMEMLDRRGVLSNAIVVVLSDHGEALGLPVDNLLHSREAKDAVGKQLISTIGHGASVLSPTQYQVVLAVRRFNARNYVSAPRTSGVPASLEDVAPTVLSMLGAKFDAADFDGTSLAETIAGKKAVGVGANRVRFTETGLTTTFMRMGDFSDEANLIEGVKFFEVDGRTSRVVFRLERMSDLIEQKERAAIGERWILAGLPDPDAGRAKYVLVSREGGTPEVVTHEPQSITHPEFARLWRALQSRYGEELGAAIR